MATKVVVREVPVSRYSYPEEVDHDAARMVLSAMACIAGHQLVAGELRRAAEQLMIDAKQVLRKDETVLREALYDLGSSGRPRDELFAIAKWLYEIREFEIDVTLLANNLLGMSGARFLGLLNKQVKYTCERCGGRLSACGQWRKRDGQTLCARCFDIADAKTSSGDSCSPEGGYTAHNKSDKRAVEYRYYIESDWWAQRRQRALAMAEQRCQICCSTGPLDVHHRSYERLYREADADLVVLCKECHALFHNKIPKPYSDGDGS